MFARIPLKWASETAPFWNGKLSFLAGLVKFQRTVSSKRTFVFVILENVAITSCWTLSAMADMLEVSKGLHAYLCVGLPTLFINHARPVHYSNSYQPIDLLPSSFMLLRVAVCHSLTTIKLSSPAPALARPTDHYALQVFYFFIQSTFSDVCQPIVSKLSRMIFFELPLN